jgi:hypothetical protein
VIKFVSDLRQVGWFSPDPLVSSTNKIDRHDITEIVLKVVLNTIKTFTTSVVIGTDCIGSCKSNYHTITATTAPSVSEMWPDKRVAFSGRGLLRQELLYS